MVKEVTEEEKGQKMAWRAKTEVLHCQRWEVRKHLPASKNRNSPGTTAGGKQAVPKALAINHQYNAYFHWNLAACQTSLSVKVLSQRSVCWQPTLFHISHAPSLPSCLGSLSFLLPNLQAAITKSLTFNEKAHSESHIGPTSVKDTKLPIHFCSLEQQCSGDAKCIFPYS